NDASDLCRRRAPRSGRMPQERLLDRREFLKTSTITTLAAAISQAPGVLAQPQPVAGKADYTLRIRRAKVELAPDHVISTITYNDQFPGPLVRLKEGQRVTVDIFNDTDVPEQLH